MAKPRRQRRTRIRTAASTVQARFRTRIEGLREDPTRVLPESVGPEPSGVAKVRRRLERIAGGKVGLLDRRDKGIVGAVASSLPLADMDAFPRLMDQQVAGKRRFFLQRGHVSPECTLGVQNHDDPLALLTAWRALAHKDRIHFFAGTRLWCSGDRPSPPDDWWDALGRDAGLRLQPQGDRGDHGCPHADRSRVLLTFPDGGPTLAVCAQCAPKDKDGSGNLHGRIAQRHAGPSRRQPVEVAVLLAGGDRPPLPRERVASYRAGLVDEEELLREAVSSWRQDSSGTGAYLVGETSFPDQGSFLDALDLRPWEREPVRAMTLDGHSGPSLALPAILKAHRDRLADGVATLLGEDGTGFVRSHGRVSPREMLRLAHEEADARARLTDLPEPQDLGPVGHWVDAVVRHARTHSVRQTLDHIRKTLGTRGVSPLHAYAFVQALGGAELSMDAHFTADQKEGGRAWKDLAKAVLDAHGTDYVSALARYLHETGTGEDAA